MHNFTKKKNMLQRIQTIYYLVAALLLAVPFMNIPLFTIGAIDRTIFGQDKQPSADYVLLLVLILVLFAIIFSYKNRARQIKLSWFTIVLTTLALVWFYIGAITNNEQHVSIQIGFYCVALSLFFQRMGLRGVKKDKKLIDSMDRLR
jgi:hypothetical protein